MSQVVKILGIVVIVAAIFFLVSCSNRSPFYNKQQISQVLPQSSVVQPLHQVVSQLEVAIPDPQPVSRDPTPLPQE